MIQSQALAILKTGANVFLTGEPGAGKTHTINEYVRYLRSFSIEPAITASTGIAATHIGGMTIHSWSGIGIRQNLSNRDIQTIVSTNYIYERIAKASVLIIDEVSMLQPETLTSVNLVCQAVKKNDKPFGGIQVIFVGDFFQLSPVQKKEIFQERTPDQTLFGYEEIEAPRPTFAYDSPAWEEANPLICYLTEQYRQDDDTYLRLLTAIRQNTFEESHLEHLEKRKITREQIPGDIPKLYSKNVAVDTTNDSILSKLSTKSHEFLMKTEGIEGIINVLKNGCLSPERLVLKVGASVMFTKNNPKEGFVNGTLGVVEGFNTENGYPLVKTRYGKVIEVKPMDWQVDEDDRTLAKISQIPLRLAWAITVHKSQGMSMDAAVMNLSDTFEYGQGYVALSRVKRLSGLYILGWNRKAFEVHPEVLKKDLEFKRSSLEAEQILAKTEEQDLKNRHESFIKLSGGRLPGEKKEVKEKNDPKAWSVDEMRKKYKNAYQPWAKEEDKRLRELYLEGTTESRLVKEFGRGKGAIRSRLVKLGLLNDLLF